MEILAVISIIIYVGYRIRAPIPCKSCSLVSYCSVACRDHAWFQHHRHECEIGGLLNEAGLSITSAMALRVITNVSVYPKHLHKATNE